MVVNMYKHMGKL